MTMRRMKDRQLRSCVIYHDRTYPIVSRVVVVVVVVCGHGENASDGALYDARGTGSGNVLEALCRKTVTTTIIIYS